MNCFVNLNLSLRTTAIFPATLSFSSSLSVYFMLLHCVSCATNNIFYRLVRKIIYRLSVRLCIKSARLSCLSYLHAGTSIINAFNFSWSNFDIVLKKLFILIVCHLAATATTMAHTSITEFANFSYYFYFLIGEYHSKLQRKIFRECTVNSCYFISSQRLKLPFFRRRNGTSIQNCKVSKMARTVQFCVEIWLHVLFLSGIMLILAHA